MFDRMILSIDLAARKLENIISKGGGSDTYLDKIVIQKTKSEAGEDANVT